MDDRFLPHSEGSNEMVGVRSGIVTLLAAAVLISAIFVLFALSDARDDSRTATPAIFISAEAKAMGEIWWRNVIAGNTEATLGISHPDAQFDFEQLSAAAPGGDAAVAVAVDSVPFGAEDRPQLCYIILAPGEQHTGSLLFREADGLWLVAAVLPDAVACQVSSPPG